MRTKHLILLLGTILFIHLQAVPRQFVVVELFTSTTCTACPGAAWGLDDLDANGHAVAPLTDHLNDPFQTLTTLGRRDYYGVTGTPTAFFDGLDPCSSASSGTSLYPEYLARLNTRMLTPAKYTLMASGIRDSLTCLVQIDVVKAEADTNSHVVLHLAVTETSIPHNWWPNNTEVNFVNRMMVPDHNGTPVNLDTLAVAGQLQLQTEFVLKEDWQQSNIEVLIWLQNSLTREILQSARYSLSDLLRQKSPEPVITLENGYLWLRWPPLPFATSYAIWHSDSADGTFVHEVSVTDPEYSERLGDGPRRFFRVQALYQ